MEVREIARYIPGMRLTGVTSVAERIVPALLAGAYIPALYTEGPLLGSGLYEIGDTAVVNY